MDAPQTHSLAYAKEYLDRLLNMLAAFARHHTNIVRVECNHQTFVWLRELADRASALDEQVGEALMPPASVPIVVNDAVPFLALHLYGGWGGNSHLATIYLAALAPQP